MSFQINLLTPSQAQQYIQELQKLIEQQGYTLVGQTETLFSQCNGSPSGKCNISLSTILLERPAQGSYFLIVPVKWAMAINAPPDAGLCQWFSATRTISVYGIRRLSNNNQVKELLTSFNASGYFDNFAQCNQLNFSQYDITVIGAGDRYYSLVNYAIPLLVHESYDAIELDVEISIQNALDSSCQNSYYAQCYLEISNVLVYYFDIVTFLNSLSLLLTLLSFLLGLL